jgi:hypothetical protein
MWNCFRYFDICFGIHSSESYISDGGPAHIQAVIESGALSYAVDCLPTYCGCSGVCRRLVELSLSADVKIALPVVRLNILCGSSSSVHHYVDAAGSVHRQYIFWRCIAD